jgi:hypothetical protein
MAPKKTVAKKPAKKPINKHRPCTVPEICQYLVELNDYLQKLTADYKKTKIAVCNLDLKVWGAGGTLDNRLCVGGTTVEPADPPPPPIW